MIIQKLATVYFISKYMEMTYHDISSVESWITSDGTYSKMFNDLICINDICW